MQERDVGVGGGSRATLADAVAPFSAAVKLAVTSAATVPVEMPNDPTFAPADTVTDAGEVNAADALLVNVTTAPPGKAGCERLTVQVVL